MPRAVWAREGEGDFCARVSKERREARALRRRDGQAHAPGDGGVGAKSKFYLFIFSFLIESLVSFFLPSSQQSLAGCASRFMWKQR